MCSTMQHGRCRTRSYWWDVFHFEPHFAPNNRPISPGKDGSYEIPRIGDRREKAGIAYISTAFSTSTSHSILFQAFLDQRFQDCDILNWPYTTTAIDTPVTNANLLLPFSWSQYGFLFANICYQIPDMTPELLLSLRNRETWRDESMIMNEDGRNTVNTLSIQ